MKIKSKLSAKMYSVLFFGSLLLFTNCKKDSNLVPTSDESFVDTIGLKNSFQKLEATISSDAYYAVNALPKGYVKDGSKDYTSYLQSAINKYKEVVFPAFPIMVNSNGLKIGSNRTLTFLSGSKLILKPTSNNYYNILKVDRASNVVINNPVIYGDRAKHMSTGARMGMGIAIYSSSYVTVNNAKIYNTYGDGIYIGRSSTEITYCKNPKIVNAYIKGCARNGISIVASDGLVVQKLYSGYNGLTGFDIEGNYGIEEQRNMTISDVTTERNENNGFAIGLSRAYASRNKTIGKINIINHRDIASTRYAFKVSMKKPSGDYGSYTGTVTVTNPSYSKPGAERPNHYVVYESGFKTYIKGPEVQTASGTWLSNSQTEDLMDKNIREGFCSISF